MKRFLPFVPHVFIKVLAVTLILVLAGFGIVILVAGSMTKTDVFGTLISALIFSYMVHLWLLPPDRY